MNQIQIGKFIASERRSKSLTQRQLADMLAISDKTVSKWECGNGLPEVSLMLPLCKILEISVNELLSGERISQENYKNRAEENIMDLIKEKAESRKKIILAWVVALMCILSGIPLMLIAGLFEMATALRVALIAIALVVIVMGIAVACVLDRDAGAFECPECKTRFVPTIGAYVAGPHTITKRQLKCPNCGKIHYCKHVLTK